MNKQPKQKMSIEDENCLYVISQYKETCATCRKYGHKSKDWSYREGAKAPWFNYCDKPVHVNKEF